jgi:Cell division protein CrgA
MAKPSANPNPNPKKSVGRYVHPEVRGKVTARRPADTKHSPRWYGQLLLSMLIIGMLIIVLNYLLVLPGSASAWYLALGLVTMFTGFYLFTHYK